MNKNITNNLFSLEEAINNGTIFKSIYVPYKKTPKLVAENDKDIKLKKIQEYSVALMDLNLYLDIHPNDIKILQLYKKYNDEFKNLVKEFENKFYPLKTESANSTIKWEWLEGKWPWEGEKDV